MELTGKVLPSILVGELFFPHGEDGAYVADVVRRVAGEGFYRGVEIGILFEEANRRAVRDICEKNQIQITQWGTYVMGNEGLNLTSLDPALRKKSVERVKDFIKMGAECATKNISILSGADPGQAKRQEGYKVFADSVCEIYDCLKQFDNMNLLIEPLDREVHKKNLIGPICDTVPFMETIRKSCERVYLVWDAAHVALGNEDLVNSMLLCGQYISEIHLSNAILNPQDPMYGDWHIMCGKPGFLSEQVAATLLRTLASTGAPELEHLYVSVETRTSEGMDFWGVEAQTRAFLQNAAKLA